MRVKICGIHSENDIDVVVRSDADAAGFLVGQMHPSPDFILPSTAARLAKLLPPYICPVLVTHLNEPQAILEIVLKSSIFTIQLHGGCTKDEVKELNKKLPPYAKLILSMHISSGQIVPKDLDHFFPLIDSILLDCYNHDKKTVDSTGFKSNWKIAKDFIAASPLPVILAGGLTPDNVAQAIKATNPYGVDANSSLKDIEGGETFVGKMPFVCDQCQTVGNNLPKPEKSIIVSPYHIRPIGSVRS